MAKSMIPRWSTPSFYSIYTVLALIFLKTAATQFVSPCPKLFQYEKQTERDKWYGTVTLISEAELSGVWLRITFDKPSIQLGNWFGEVEPRDNNKAYLIKNRNHKLPANTPMQVRFFIKYDPNDTPPKLTGFFLNARKQCPDGEDTTTPSSNGAELLTSPPQTNFPSPSRPTQSIGAGSAPVFNQDSFSANIPDDNDFFQGDLQLIGKPHKPTQPLLEGECGTVIKQPRPLITHGQETHEGEFPWHAALYHARGIDLTYICGANLISRQHLLTVAHCVTRRKTQTSVSPASLVVYLGKYYLKQWSNPGIQDKQVEKVILHPDYNARTFSNDIAVLKLSSSVDVTDYVRPVCLWEGPAHLDKVVNQLGSVVGWGFDETGKVTEQLTKAHMPIVSQETCIYSFPDFYSRFTNNGTFCAGFKNGTSVCNGDSGGGLVLPKANSNKNNPVWQIRGLVSISVALQNQFRCDASHYVVFTDVAKYMGWIKEAMNM